MKNKSDDVIFQSGICYRSVANSYDRRAKFEILPAFLAKDASEKRRKL